MSKDGMDLTTALKLLQRAHKTLNNTVSYTDIAEDLEKVEEYIRSFITFERKFEHKFVSELGAKIMEIDYWEKEELDPIIEWIIEELDLDMTNYDDEEEEE